jgi:outer membrane autotransporter protein
MWLHGSSWLSHGERGRPVMYQRHIEYRWVSTLRRNALSSIAVAVLAGAFSGGSNPAFAQVVINCNSLGTVIPGGGPVGAFNVWGPSAVCSAAASTAALTATIANANSVFLTNTSAFIGSPPGAPNSGAGGVWIRGIGGSVETKAQGTFTIPVPGFPGATLEAKTRSNYAGVQAGVDVARLNMGASGWNGHVGVTGGYLSTDNTDLIGQASGDSGVPFLGIYGALTHSSGFFSDALLRWDWYSSSVTNTAVGVSNQSLDARGVSLTMSAGYRFALAQAWFIEPSASFVWSNVTVNSLNVPGGGPFGVPNGTLTIDDIHSLLARAGVRVGTTLTTPTIAWQPYAIVNIWREFEGDATSHFTCASAAVCAFPLNVATSRIGTYGQYGLGVAAQALQTGWLGYARVDYRKGDNIDGWGVALGLRYQWQDAAVAPARIITK